MAIILKYRAERGNRLSENPDAKSKEPDRRASGGTQDDPEKRQRACGRRGARTIAADARPPCALREATESLIFPERLEQFSLVAR
ncbi:hypothetical protein [Bosea sp. (in: a-proteobacteria)]